MTCLERLGEGHENHQSWRNLILHEVASEIAEQSGTTRVPIVHLGEMTLPLWDAHVGGLKFDCTHFCYHPGLIDGFLHEIATILKEGDTYQQLEEGVPTIEPPVPLEALETPAVNRTSPPEAPEAEVRPAVTEKSPPEPVSPLPRKPLKKFT